MRPQTSDYVAEIWREKQRREADARKWRKLTYAAQFVLTFLAGMAIAVAAPWVIALLGAHTLTGGGR